MIDRVILPDTAEPITGHANRTAPANTNKTIVETAMEAGDFQTLVTAIQAAELADALSGEGPFTVFAPTDAAFAKLPAGTVESLVQPENRAKLQKGLVSAAVKVLKPGGTLVYSTCSLEPEEDELVIDWALSNHPLCLQTVDLTIGDPGLTNVHGKELHPDIKKCRRLWPHKTGTQGFFLAKLKKIQ